MAVERSLLCPACGSTQSRMLVELPSLPVLCNQLLPTRAEARNAPLGTLALAFCDECGHVYNASFDPALMVYTQAYENSLHFSPSFQRYAEELADHLITRYGLRGKDIIDLGCGKGDFLKLICARGGNRGTGFDPSYIPDPLDSDPASTVRFVREFYSERHTAYPADLISCRHVLEHIHRPREVVEGLRRSVGNRHGTAIYFEVPNVLYTLRDMGIWDLIYEHCAYFSAPSLMRLFVSAGFDVHAVGESFGGQYLGLEARPSTAARGRTTPGVPGPKDILPFAEQFAAGYLGKVAEWKRRVTDLRREGKRAVVWGGGSKGVTFLNTFKAGDQMDVMVDINPRKQGLYVPGTGQQIVGPEHLRTSPPDVIVVMNPLYRDEIRVQAIALGVRAEIVVA
jgi:SAM-dependent methyltransferase